MKRIALFFALAVAAIACTPEETVTPEIKVVPAESELLLPTEGGELTIKFNTNVDWTASVKEADAKEWCSLSPATGKPGDNTLKVIALENEGTENRTVTVVITAMEATAEVVVTQLQKDALVLTGNKSFEVPYQGQNLEFAVSHNSELKAEADVEWITEVKAKAVEESKLTFAVAPNTGEARTGKITFTAGSLKEVVEVKQAAWVLEFTVTPEDETKTFEAEGGEYEVTVAANVEYTVNVPENDWLTVADAEGVYTFTAAANTTPAVREVTVTIAPKDEKLAEAAVAIKMNQKGAGATLEVSDEDKADKWFAPAAATFELAVNTNIEVEVSYSWDREGSDEWITYTESAGVYTFAVAENPGWDLRSAYVNIVPVDEAYAELAVAVAVFQNGHASKMWSKEVKTIDGFDPALKSRLALYGDKLLLANTTQVYMMNPATGDIEATIPMPEGVNAHSVLVDDAGNLMIACDGKPKFVDGDSDGDGVIAEGEQINIGEDVKLYYVPDPTNPSPEEVLMWNTANYYGTDFGNFRVKGNIKEDAVIAAVVSAGADGAVILWEVVDGIVGDWTWTNVPYAGSTVASACVYPMGTSLADGLLYAGYGGDYNLYYAATVSENQADWKVSYVTGSSWMENYNCIATAEWKGNEYAAIVRGCHFNYDMTDVVLLNVNDPSNAEELYFYDAQNDAAWDWVANANTSWTGSGSYSDVLLIPTEDALLMVYVDSNYGTMACIAIQ